MPMLHYAKLWNSGIETICGKHLRVMWCNLIERWVFARCLVPDCPL
jgi:hypothetical protein